MGMESQRKRFMEDTILYNPHLMGKAKRYHAPSSRCKPYGAIAGIEPGTKFKNRRACYDAGVHTALYAGINGSSTGAYSVCLSGGYEDDEDGGDSFVYTGTGGQGDSFAGNHKQVEDQSLLHAHNASLMASVKLQRPVRVIRGHSLNSKYAPGTGYRYDGLYRVDEGYFEEGCSGHQVLRFQFRRLPDQSPIPVKLVLF